MVLNIGVGLQLHKTLVRPHVEYYSGRAAIGIISEQKIFMRMLADLEGFSYQDSLGYFTIECRRLRRDLTEDYKIIRVIDKMYVKQAASGIGSQLQHSKDTRIDTWIGMVSMDGIGARCRELGLLI